MFIVVVESRFGKCGERSATTLTNLSLSMLAGHSRDMWISILVFGSVGSRHDPHSGSCRASFATLVPTSGSWVVNFRDLACGSLVGFTHTSFGSPALTCGWREWLVCY